MTKQIEALRRGLVVLDLLDSGGPHALADLAKTTLLAKPTLLRILGTLAATGHVRRGLMDGLWRSTGRQRPSPGPSDLLAEVSAPVLDALCQRVLWPSDVGRYRDGAIRVLETSRRLSPFLVNRTIAEGIHVMPSAMGRAILAFTSDADRARIMDGLITRGAPYDVAVRDPAALESMIASVRAKGYAVRHPGYYISVPQEGLVSAIAVPVMMDGIAIAAINLSWITSAMTEANFAAAHLADLQRAAAALSENFAKRHDVAGNR